MAPKRKTRAVLALVQVERSWKKTHHQMFPKPSEGWAWLRALPAKRESSMAHLLPTRYPKQWSHYPG